MRRKFKVVMLFQKRLLPTTFMLSLAIGGAVGMSTGGSILYEIGSAYFKLAPLIHLFVYDFRKSKEYLFYYNLGFLKWQLWLSTVGFTVLITSILWLQ
ncbi:MAG: hypothetical protein WBG71_11065 [Leeuwenhoekiella sp.]